jgi:hypothetical protein
MAVEVLTDVDDQRARILFNWQDKVDITPSLVGNQLAIQFNQNEKVDVQKLLENLRPFIINANQPNDRQVIITLSEPLNVQAFSDGKANGVDLLLPAQVKDENTLNGKPIDNENPVLTTTPKSKGKNIITTEEPPQSILMIPVPKPEYQPVVANDKQDKTNKLFQLAKQLNQGKMVVGVKKTPIAADLFFPFHERVAVGSFTYGDDLFVFFSGQENIDIAKLDSALPSFVSEVEQIYHKDAIIMRYKGQPNTKLYSKAKQTGNGYEWKLEISRRASLPEHVIVPEFVSKPPITPHIFLPALQMAKPIDFKHPVTGESITVIPSYEDNSGIFPQRMLPEITMLRTGQGIAYISEQPDVRILKLRQGLRITKQGGLSITKNAPNLPLDELLSAEASSHTFYPYESWKPKEGSDFAATERQLLQDISISDERKLPALRLALLELYMAEGFYMEALGLLEMLKRASPDFFADYQLAALSGAANFMVGRLAEAELFFADATLQDADEIKLWQRILEISNGKKRNLNYFDYNKRYISSYPPAMRRKLAVFAVDSAMANKRYEQARGILQNMAVEQIGDGLHNYMAYVHGRIAAERGDLMAAEKILNPIIADVENNFTRARAAFTLATNRYKAGQIDRPTLIAELERVNLLWRGDNFELNLLNLLGELYINNEQPLEGLRAWRDVITYFPSSEIALEVAGRMANTFVSFFNDGKADELSPLAALALYYEFRDLTPIGVAGDKMVQQLADRLIAVDLLDKAAKLLEYQVTYRLDKAERSKIGAKLAWIYLMDRRPQKTLQVLELTGYGDNDEAIARKRNHLAAVAYGKIGEWQRAINLLRDDYSREAKYVRSDIYWDIKDWHSLAINLEDILGNRAIPTDPLNSQEVQSLLRLCVAYSFMGDSKQLEYLKDYFTPLVVAEEDAKTFAFLTSATETINRDNITKVTAEIDKMKDFLDNYKVSLENKTLSSLMASN